MSKTKKNMLSLSKGCWVSSRESNLTENNDEITTWSDLTSDFVGSKCKESQNNSWWPPDRFPTTTVTGRRCLLTTGVKGQCCCAILAVLQRDRNTFLEAKGEKEKSWGGKWEGLNESTGRSGLAWMKEREDGCVVLGTRKLSWRQVIYFDRHVIAQ